MYLLYLYTFKNKKSKLVLSSSTDLDLCIPLYTNSHNHGMSWNPSIVVFTCDHERSMSHHFDDLKNPDEQNNLIGVNISNHIYSLFYELSHDESNP